MSITYRDQISRDLTPAEVDANFRAFTDTAGGGSANVTFIQSGTGAGPRNLQGKNREILSVTDFYANGSSGANVVGDGVTDCTTGIQNAINYAYDSGIGGVYFPAGNYKI